MLTKTPRFLDRRLQRSVARNSVARFTQPPQSPDPLPPPVPHYVIPGSHLLDPPFASMDNPPIWTAPPGMSGTSGIEEAPMDGGVYGRQSGAWTPIQSQQGVTTTGDLVGEWQVTAQTISSDPGNGKLKFNTDAQGDATEIYLSEKSVPGTDMSNWIAQNPVKIFIQRKNDSTRIGRWNISSIVDNTTWFVLTVTPEGTAAGFPMAGNDAVIVLFRW